MNTSKLIIFQVIITLTFCARLSFNTPECNKYLEKFGTADNSDGTGASKIAFSGDASFIGTTSDVKVNIKYSDVDYFNDQTYYGLVIEDGKTLEKTCLDMKLYKFNSNDYQNGIQVNDLKISPSSNFSKQWRYYSFTIVGTELPTRTVQTSNSNSFIYKGYYGIAFYAAGTDQLQYTFYFDFTVTVDKLTGSAVDTGLIPLSLSATADCNPTGACTVDSQATLKWCTDFTCTTFTTPDLKFNDSFYLLQIITQQEMQNYYLTQTEVWYTGDGLNKKATILQSDNSQKGQVKLQLNASIAWTQVTLAITSVLASDPNGRRRLLTTQSTFDTLLASSNIECIKDQGSQTCSTCEQECKINGFSRQGCDFCSEVRLKLTLLLAMLLFQFLV